MQCYIAGAISTEGAEGQQTCRNHNAAPEATHTPADCYQSCMGISKTGCPYTLQKNDTANDGDPSPRLSQKVDIGVPWKPACKTTQVG